MKFSEKSTGYIATGIMLNEKTDPAIFERVMTSISNDISSGNEICEALALATVGNIGSQELAKALAGGVIRKAFGSGVSVGV